MDANSGRNQTTKGIWIAKCGGIEPYTIAMDLDLQGTDGKERGKDDTAFEKQTATFALAVSDIVLINMCQESDTGREQASMNPLLKMVFQVVMHSFVPRKMTLLFVIHTKTPFENLEPVLREDIQKGTPKQPTSTKCGYFLMRYMKEIVEDKNLEFASKWSKTNDCTYTQNQIDEVWREWAGYV